MTINLQKPDIAELKPRINVFGVGGGGGNAVNNMINAGLQGVEFVVANTDAQALAMSKAQRLIQLGATVTEGLGAGSHPEVGRAAAEECMDEILDHLSHSHMVFVTAGMGGGTGTGAAPVIARAAREKGLLTVGVVTKPFHFEGQRRMKTAEAGIEELQRNVDTLIVIPNQNLFRIANEKTTFSDAFAMADQVLYSGVASITDLMVREGLINLDFADVRSVMHNMGKAMMGTGEASDKGRALAAAEAAIANPLLDETSMRGARGLLISITGGRDMTLFEVDEAANRIREEVDPEANVIFGAIVDEALEGMVRVSVVATGIERGASDVVSVPFVAENRVELKSEASVLDVMDAATVQTEKLREVMVALDEEMAKPAAEVFRPKSQIFGKTMQTKAGYTVFPEGSVLDSLDSEEKRLAQLREAKNQAAILSSSLQSMMTKEATVTEKQAGVRIPGLDEFEQELHYPIRKKEKGQRQEEPEGPRSLWRRLTQGFTDRVEDKEITRSEPVRASSSTAASEIRQSLAEASRRVQIHSLEDEMGYVTRNKPKVAKKIEETEEEKLEIPAFLRRQVN